MSELSKMLEESGLIENNEKLMGFESDGVDLETDVVRPNNRVWNRSRISKVVNGLGTTTDMKLLLRPLFCAEDINLLSNFGDRVSSGQLSEQLAAVLGRGS